MNLELIIQSEVSQKKKDKHGIQKNGAEKYVYTETMLKQTQRIDLWKWGEGMRG